MVLLGRTRRGFTEAMRFLLLAIAFAFVAAEASAVYYGQTRAEVLQELGKPTSELKRGEREILIYKAGRLELEDGKVAVVQGLPVTDGPVAAPAVQPAPSVPEPATAQAEPKSAPAPTPAPKAAEKTKPGTEQELIEADATARTKMEKEIEALENPPPARGSLPAGPPRWLTFLVELLIKAFMTLAALWLTTKYWSVEISWFGLGMAALADTVTRAIVGAVALWALGMGTTMYADEATAGIILVVVLRKVSYNQSLGQAVTIALTTKTFSIVVGSFLTVFLMHTLFGGSGGLMPF